VAHLHRDGAVIIDRVVSEETCDNVVKEMQPYIDACPTADNEFLGLRTRRVGSLAARSKASWEILAHPVLMDACAGVLGFQMLHGPPSKPFAPGYRVQPWQLMLTQIIQIGAGEPAQPLHRDRWAFIADMAFEQAALEPELSTIWALTEFTPDSGPTRVVPGSHRWPSEEAAEAEGRNAKEVQASLAARAAHAAMPKGSVVIYTGTVLHSGGANRSNAPRIGLNVDYNLGWLRQEENQYLACPPSIAKSLPPSISKLIGYDRKGALGYYADVKEPADSWKETRPLNWASTWEQDEDHADWQHPALAKGKL